MSPKVNELALSLPPQQTNRVKRPLLCPLYGDAIPKKAEFIDEPGLQLFRYKLGHCAIKSQGTVMHHSPCHCFTDGKAAAQKEGSGTGLLLAAPPC